MKINWEIQDALPTPHTDVPSLLDLLSYNTKCVQISQHVVVKDTKVWVLEDAPLHTGLAV